MLLPSSSTIRSPGLMPARDAGVSSTGLTTLISPVLLRDLQPEAAEASPRLRLHVAESFRRHVARMRIEPGQHAVEGVLDQVVVGYRLHVVGAHDLEHAAEQAQQPIGLGVAHLLGEGRRGAQADTRLPTDKPEPNPAPTPAANTAPSSTSLRNRMRSPLTFQPSATSSRPRDASTLRRSPRRSGPTTGDPVNPPSQTAIARMRRI